MLRLEAHFVNKARQHELTGIPINKFTQHEQTKIIQILNSLWGIQVDEVTKKRVIQSLNIGDIPVDFTDDINRNIDDWIQNQFNPTFQNMSFTRNQIRDLGSPNTLTPSKISSKDYQYVAGESMKLKPSVIRR